MYRFTASLPYLLNRVGVRMGDLFTKELAADGLTLAAYRVLAALHEVGDQRLVDLSAMTTVEMTTLSRLVASMEGRRLLKRRRPKDNLRTVQISLLSAGRGLLAKFQPRAAYYEQTALQGLATKDVAELKEVLASIYNSLDQIEHEQADKPRARPVRRTAA